MADANYAEDLAMRLEIFPWAGRRTAQHKFEPERAGFPRLVSERGFLMLRVEGADGGERDGAMTQQHGVVVPKESRRYIADWKDGDPDHAGGLDAYIGFHFL